MIALSFTYNNGYYDSYDNDDTSFATTDSERNNDNGYDYTSYEYY